MENKVVFDNNKVLSKYYDDKTNTITFSNLNETIYFEFNNYVPNPLNLKIENSNIVLIENYHNIESINYNIQIDENSSLNRLAILLDNISLSLNKNVDNKGFYKSMQIDLNDNNIDSIENINMTLENSNSIIIDGIYAFNKANKKYQTNINHYAKDSASKASIFAINDDYAHVSIYTDAYIKNKASNVNTNQEGRIINLKETASGIVLPNLHIDENDVQASHSCSVGSLNQDHMYYLRSRGFSEKEASNLLIRGYFNPLLKNVDNEDILKELSKALDDRIG